MATEKNSLNKPNPALVMLPRIGKLTVTGRKMYNVVLKKTQIQALDIKRQGSAVDAEHFFAAPIKDLLIMDPNSKSDLTTAAKKYLREMRRIEVDWEAPDAKTGVVWQSMGLLSEARIEIRAGVAWGLWALPPSLMTAVMDPELFTTLDLNQISKLDTYAAIALYEICSRYRDNPSHVTSRNSTDWWTDALTNASPMDSKTGLINRREWRKFKSEVVIKAIDEINRLTDLNIEFLDLGRGAKESQFSVYRKKAEALKVDAPKIREDVAELAARLDVPLDYIAKLVKEGVEDSAMKIALSKLDARVNADGLDTIENRSAYLRRLIIDGENATARFQVVKLKPAAESKPKLELVESPADQRRAQAKEEFFALARDDQKVWVDKATELLREGKFLTPTLARKIQDGNWTSGLILSKTLEVYSATTYGKDWLGRVA